MTQRYMHLSPAALDAAIRLLENQPTRVERHHDQVRLKADPTYGRASTNEYVETLWRRAPRRENDQ